MQTRQSYIGIDIIEIARIDEAVLRWQNRFLQRVYTAAELGLYRGKIESLAVRFAAKEAVFKALNCPAGNISWKEIEILSKSNDQPFVKLYGQAKKRADELRLAGFDISLSHSRENAIALVIGIREE